MKHSRSAYTGARRNHWLEEICSHMAILKSPSGHWNNKEVCAKEALKCKSRSKFEVGSSSAYAIATKVGSMRSAKTCGLPICSCPEATGTLRATAWRKRASTPRPKNFTSTPEVHFKAVIATAGWMRRAQIREKQKRRRNAKSRMRRKTQLR